MIEAERPTIAGAVPTIWHGLLHYLDEHPGGDISSLQRGHRRRLGRARRR